MENNHFQFFNSIFVVVLKKFLAYTLFLPSFIVVRPQMAELNWGGGAFLKHGRSTEIYAKEKYLSLMKKVHKKLKSNESGLVVMKTKTFIAASPDLEISCESCGQGLVEIKCLYSIKDTCSDAEN